MGRGCLILLLFLTAIFLAVRYLPWWGLLGGVAVLLLLLLLARRYWLRLLVWLMMRSVVRRAGFGMNDLKGGPGAAGLFLTLVQMKGSVLRNAEAEVHSIRPIPAAELEGQHADAGEPVAHVDTNPQRYFEVDVTIRPTQPGQDFQLWEPGELMLSAPETAWDASDDLCRVKWVEVEENGSFYPDKGIKYAGPQRLHLLIRVRPDVERLMFRYYTEKFGTVVLPPTAALPSR